MNQDRDFRGFITPANIAHLRFIAKMRQVDAAETIGCQEQMWCLWESGKHRMPYVRFEAFALKTLMTVDDAEMVWGETGEIQGLLSNETIVRALPYRDKFLITCAFKRQCRERDENKPYLFWNVTASQSYSTDAYELALAFYKTQKASRFVNQ